jgi:hypothetical protein
MQSQLVVEISKTLDYPIIVGNIKKTLCLSILGPFEMKNVTPTLTIHASKQCFST